MSLSSYHVQSENSRWQAPETYEETSTPQFAADIYALGMCMIEVLQQGGPVAQQTVLNREISDLRPEHVSDEAWEFIESLCGAKCHERPSLSDVQERIHTLRGQVTDFPVSGRRGQSSLKALSALDTRLTRMPENEGLCRQVLSRLQILHDSVAPLNATDYLKTDYETVIARLAKIARQKPLLSRLADSEKLVVKIQEMQLKLSDVAQGLGLADKSAMTQWELRWDSDRAEQYSKLFELVTGASERMLVNEFQSDKKVQEALMVLKNGMKWKDQSPKMLELKQATLSRVSGFLGHVKFRLYDWFIPFDDLECEKMDIFSCISKGTWLHDGERTDVAVKRRSYDFEDDVIRTLELQYNFPENEHILKVYGGCHIRPQFYVCEYAPYGRLWEYMEDEEHMTQFWQLFLQAAQAKLTDFGELSEAEFRRASSLTTLGGHELRIKCVRLQPREVVLDNNDELRFESDTYTLGMCMIQILTRELPFGYDDDNEAIEKILSGESYPQPDEISDSAWGLISRLCDPDFEKRPALEDVIADIHELAVNNVDPRRIPDDSVHEGAAREISDTPSTPSEQDTIQTTTCSSCSEASCAFEQWCQYCGNCVCAGNTDVDSQSFASIVKRHTRTEVLQKLYEISIILQELHTSNIVYGDLKPANIRIGRDGKAQFSDFKYCTELLGPTPCSSRERSVRWQAPECLRGQRPTLASDIYSFGMCFIYAVSGEPPWGSSLADEDIQCEVCDQKRMPPGLYKLRDDDLKLVEQMCEHEPRMRPTISDVVRHIAKSVEGDQHPQWIMSRGLPQDSEVVPLSTTALVSRQLGWWKDARVCVEKPTGTFKRTSRSFRAVADLWFSLKHPSILPLYRAYEEDDDQCFICEYAEGGALRSYLDDHRPDSTHVWQIVLDVALGLLYMHSVNIAHGDVGPHNILVGSGGRGKLSGLFLSTKMDNLVKNNSPEEEPSESISTTCRIAHPASLESDVYDLGVCIIEAFRTQTDFGCEDSPPAPACAVCAPRHQLMRSETFNDEEWLLILNMCCEEPSRRIVMEQVVDRLKRFVAVRVAIDKGLPTLSGVRLNLDQQKQLQVLLLTNIRENESTRSSSDRGAPFDSCEATDDSDSFSYNGSLCDSLSTSSSSVDYTSAILHPRQVSFQSPPIEFLAENAARELMTEALLPRLLGYTGTRVPTVDHVPSTSIRKRLPMQLRAAWGIHHECLERIERGLISTGSFGSVARGLWFGAAVALKRLHKFDLDQFQALMVETNLWYGLRHPHIASLFGACTGGYQLLVSELMEGGRLDKHLTTGLGVEATWGLLQDAAVGLQGLRLHGVVHADLKCDNILVSGDGRAKLIDFGLSCVHTVDGGSCQAAERWKAPECLQGEGPTFASDVFSFGMCIVQAVSGRLPWGPDMPGIAVRYHVVRAQLPSKPDAFTPVQWELVKRMCRFEPEDRLDIDFVVKVLGYFAKRAPYVDDERVQEILATWESEAQAATLHAIR